MILETVQVGPMQVNCYILASAKGKGAILIDPGAQEHKIKKVLKSYQLTPAMVVNTHGHYDHIGCDDAFGVPVYIHRADAAFLTDPQLNLSGVFALPYCVESEMRLLDEHDRLELDDILLEVLHLPGHTPGGIGLLLKKPVNNIVFTGDTLFCQGVGRTDLDEGSHEELVRSIKTRLFVLSDETVAYPGHGGSTTIGEERRSNPFVQP